MSIESVEIGRLWLQLKRMADVLTASQKDLFVRLPGMTGYFPMSAVNTAAKAINHAAGGMDLTQTGVCPIGYDTNAYRQLGNGTNFLYSSLDYTLSGLETYIETALRGFTIGGWFKFDALPSNSSGLISKDGIAANRGYGLVITTSAEISFRMSSDGTATDSLVSSGVITDGQWYFLVGRFTPSVEMAVFIDGAKTIKTSSIAASNYVSSQAFEVGRYRNDNTRIPTVKVRDVFVTRAILSDELINETRLASLPS